METYESIHGKDVSSFDFSSTHRLPTVSAAQALDELKTDPRQFIPTGLDALDQALAEVSGVSFEDGDGSQRCRGIQKGQVVEIWGPPASGKTTLAMQMAASTLRDSRGVVWVGSNAVARRLQILQYLVSALQKLSATRDILIVLLSQCATRMQADRGAALTPAISASNWEQGIATRLVLFQDWTVVSSELRSVRLVANPRHQKRKFTETDFEIADSEEEDYGWEDEDEAQMPNMPPQWQGSEDLLLGRVEEEDDDDGSLTAEMSEPEESSFENVAPEF
ncbi:hypothetical protein ONZ43_g2614 [Nemania bipapillata]|uniref:Uncharacterized protein n=1 Tax=Nemania bipapillata TaxID=110536 RepID=A0ACC2J0Q3_9PEZI|nr:hypothetical protein ONZ43_g2614 [Nemania bipapillata]